MLKTQELDDDEKAIRDWILKHPRKTENKVAKAMMEIGQCHRLTALKKIDRLKDRHILEDIKLKSNNFSCLVVKDKNEFKLIYEQLKRIEKSIEMMDEPIQKLIKLETQGNPGKLIAISYMKNLVVPYIEGNSTMLRDLLFRARDDVVSKEDYLTLHEQTILLMKKLTEQVTDLKNSKELLAHSKERLIKTRNELSDPGTRNNICNSKMLDYLLESQEGYEKCFLN